MYNMLSYTYIYTHNMYSNIVYIYIYILYNDTVYIYIYIYHIYNDTVCIYNIHIMTYIYVYIHSSICLLSMYHWHRGTRAGLHPTGHDEHLGTGIQSFPNVVEKP